VPIYLQTRRSFIEEHMPNRHSTAKEQSSPDHARIHIFANSALCRNYAAKKQLANLCSAVEIYRERTIATTVLCRRRAIIAGSHTCPYICKLGTMPQLCRQRAPGKFVLRRRNLSRKSNRHHGVLSRKNNRHHGTLPQKSDHRRIPRVLIYLQTRCSAATMPPKSTWRIRAPP
jgi:hypothetical protein